MIMSQSTDCMACIFRLRVCIRVRVYTRATLAIGQGVAGKQSQVVWQSLNASRWKSNNINNNKSQNRHPQRRHRFII